MTHEFVDAHVDVCVQVVAFSYVMSVTHDGTCEGVMPRTSPHT